MNANELRELDVWIAVNLFGIGAAKRSLGSNYWTLKTVNGEDVGQVEESSIEKAWIFGCKHYTTDPAAAMEVLKKCVEHFENHPNEACVTIQKDGVTWNVNVANEFNAPCAEGFSMELAICLFAKKCLYPKI